MSYFVNTDRQKQDKTLKKTEPQFFIYLFIRIWKTKKVQHYTENKR